MNAPGPTLAELIDVALRDKLPLKIDWAKLHSRAVSAALAEHILLWAELVPRSGDDPTKPDPDFVETINFALRHKLPGDVKWTDKRESDVVAYAVAEHVQCAFEVKPRRPVERASEPT